MDNIGVLAAGSKGVDFVIDFAAEHRIGCVWSYRQGQTDPSFDRLVEWCASNGTKCVIERRPSREDLQTMSLSFSVGWQFLLDPNVDNVIVMHDSLLPKYRGFAPTVAALIEGDTRIGVTAIGLAKEVDEGAIFAQESVEVSYPLRIAEAFQRLRPIYLSLALEVLRLRSTDLLVGRPQDPLDATFSIWRDSDDYLINFEKDAAAIVRFVHAVGEPYEGASMYLGSKLLRVFDAEECPDVPFVVRHPGKIWRLEATGPVVVCGEGMVRLKDVRLEGENYSIGSLRQRLRNHPATR